MYPDALVGHIRDNMRATPVFESFTVGVDVAAGNNLVQVASGGWRSLLKTKIDTTPCNE
jgi:hypothetical protein